MTKVATSDGFHTFTELNAVNERHPYSRRLEVFQPRDIRLLRDIPPMRFGWTQDDIDEYGEDDFITLTQGMTVQLINFGGSVMVGHFPSGSGSGETIRDYTQFQEGVDFEFI